MKKLKSSTLTAPPFMNVSWRKDPERPFKDGSIGNAETLEEQSKLHWRWATKWMMMDVLLKVISINMQGPPPHSAWNA
ncbi:hypothetical protein GOP47_0011189 [Adiantum capillus-veneris]|uniref:Uncharacterized protein n=1 Tax=Adiantum capillus-veneris TaxID=13818 RepID=A0A9D4USG5_ADICA|nr:hypothetical protein GOP47_0011189 [Adiantum capillus-veneris]